MESGAEWMVPMHYGTFQLGREPMNEPIERLTAEAARLGIGNRIRVLEEGETLRVGALKAVAARLELNAQRQGI
jgi:L-ascorbate metabolism protein UlaG (beta-lactamase superfamily)